MSRPSTSDHLDTMAQTISASQKTPERNPALNIMHSPRTPPRRHYPTNNATPLHARRHPVLRSQIPIRATGVDGSSYSKSPPMLAHLRTHNLQHPPLVDENFQNSFLQNVEKAFGVCGERVKADLNEVRALCMTLFAQEQEERKRLHSACIRIKRERDVACQRLQALLRGGHKQQHQQHLSSPPRVSPGLTHTMRGGKRYREDEPGCSANQSDTEVSQSSSDASTSQPRPVRPLRRSPGPLSPLPGSPELKHLPSSSTSPPPPLSSVSASATTPPCSAETDEGFSRSYASHLYPGGFTTTTCYPAVKRRKSCDSTHSSSSLSSTVVDDDNSDTKPQNYSVSNANSDKLPPIHSLLMHSDTGMGPAPISVQSSRRSRAGSLIVTGTFPHVDIMYLPVNDNLVCRACLLNASKRSLSPPSSDEQPKFTPLSSPPLPSLSPPSPTSVQGPLPKSPLLPTQFPKTASWDELRDHCVFEHPTECADVNRLHPAEIFELRRRLNL